MDEVALKSYLGIALKQVIEEMGMERKSQKILEVFIESFKSKYDQFKSTSLDMMKLDGKLVEHYEYPIGTDDKLQYYQAYGVMQITAVRRPEHGKNEVAGLLEGFSTNEGAKSVKNSKNRRPNRSRNEGGPRKRKPK